MANTTTIVNGDGYVLGIPNGRAYANSVVVSDANHNVLTVNSVPQTVIGQSGAIPLVSPPSATTANVDTLLTFSQQVQHISVQNASPLDVYVGYDTVATTGSTWLAPNTILTERVPVTVLHILTAGTTNINGSTALGITVEGTL